MRYERFLVGPRRRAGATVTIVALLALVAVAALMWLPARGTAAVAPPSPGLVSAAEGAQVTATVRTNAGCLRLRQAPTLSAPTLTCLPDGSVVTVLGDAAAEADGHRWREVDAGIARGWAAEAFLDFGGGDEGVPRFTGGMATITYYYCERGEREAAWGDGGGSCGTLRSGKPVYEGAAACAPEHFGQRFHIVGDPTARVYTCEDTGSNVGGDHRDIWFHNSDDAFAWLLAVGGRAEILVVNGDEPPGGTGEFAPEPAPGGITITLFGGSLEQFGAAGADLGLTSCFATVDGTLLGYNFGAPGFVNEPFSARFQAGLASRSLLCRRP